MIPFIIASLIGFIIGGIVGIGLDQSFSPDCWIGLILTWAMMAGVDISDAFVD